jgi:hypothetical protein
MFKIRIILIRMHWQTNIICNVACTFTNVLIRNETQLKRLNIINGL